MTASNRYRSIFRADLFAERVMLITGAGSGIGRCTAHELAELGATVVLCGRTAERLFDVQAELARMGAVASVQVLDVRDAEQVKHCVERTLLEHGRLDGLVNNAGGQFWSAMENISPNGFDAVTRTNLSGGFFLMQEAYRQWMASHGGAIVNVTAAIGRGLPGFAHSGAARAGMRNLTETAAVEWARSGVRVNSVAPGMIASSGFDRYGEPVAGRIRQYAKTIPMQRFGVVAEVSVAIVFLLSPAASFITGMELRVDGGGTHASGNWQLDAHDNSTPYDGFHLKSAPDLLAGGAAEGSP